MNSTFPAPPLLSTFKRRTEECNLCHPMSFSCFQNINMFLRGNQLSPGEGTSKQTVYFPSLSSGSLWGECSAVHVCSLPGRLQGQPEWWYVRHQPQDVLLVRCCCHIDAICLFISWHLFTQRESGKRLLSQQNGKPQSVHGQAMLYLQWVHGISSESI